MVETSKKSPKLKTIKILPTHHAWLMHEKISTEKPVYEIIGEFVEAEANRRAALEHVK